MKMPLNQALGVGLEVFLNDEPTTDSLQLPPGDGPLTHSALVCNGFIYLFPKQEIDLIDGTARAKAVNGQTYTLGFFHLEPWSPT